MHLILNTDVDFIVCKFLFCIYFVLVFEISRDNFSFQNGMSLYVEVIWKKCLFSDKIAELKFVFFAMRMVSILCYVFYVYVCIFYKL